MISLAELKTKSAESRIDISILERDYVIGWVLKGIFDDASLSEALVFKGGTALRKVYFASYRFSEDLDFTTIKPLSKLSETQIRESLEDACRKVYAQSGIELTLADFKQTRDELGEEAFEGKIQYVGPRGHRAGNPPRVKLDITLYEQVLLPPNTVPILHPYSDVEDCYAVVPTYRLDEIVAEKLRAILQRTRSRDIYDLWYLLKFHKDALNTSTIYDVFKKKCEYKNVDFKGIEDFFKPELMESHKLAWEPSIRRQIADLPVFEEVEYDLKHLLDGLR
jgi:predicted nucleotidyltransferase component of viral defense system